MGAARRIIYTVGHSTRTLKEFIQILEAHGVQLIVDVRTIPKSRHNPQFNEERLRRGLKKAGIRYKPMKGLGGLRHTTKDSVNTAWRNKSFRGFADYMQTEEFRESLKELVAISKRKRLALMCAEAVPWRCHRSLIGDALVARHLHVEDIMSTYSAREHRLTPWAVVSRGRVTYPSD